MCDATGGGPDESPFPSLPLFVLSPISEFEMSLHIAGALSVSRNPMGEHCCYIRP